jgi:hypothetical protein
MEEATDKAELEWIWTSGVGNLKLGTARLHNIQVKAVAVGLLHREASWTFEAGQAAENR